MPPATIDFDSRDYTRDTRALATFACKDDRHGTHERIKEARWTYEGYCPGIVLTVDRTWAPCACDCHNK